MTNETIDQHGDETLNAAGGSTMNPFVASLQAFQLGLEWQQRLALASLEFWPSFFRR